MNILRVLESIDETLKAILAAQRVQTTLLEQIVQKEANMTDALTQALADMDSTIQTVSNEISDMVKRLNATPPGIDGNTIAAQIEAKLNTLRSVTQPVTTIAQPAPATSSPPAASSTPAPSPNVSSPAPTPVAPAPSETSSSAAEGTSQSPPASSTSSS